jgi:hypothetical protein
MRWEKEKKENYLITDRKIELFLTISPSITGRDICKHGNSGFSDQALAQQYTKGRLRAIVNSAQRK